MKLADVVDAFRKAKPNELAEVREALAERPPERPVMEAAERRQLGAEYRTRQAALVAEREAYAKRVADAEARVTAARRELEDAYASQPDADGFKAWRETTWRRLWDERLPLVDALIASAREEAASLSWDVFKLPAEDPRLRSGGMETGPEDLARFHDKVFTNEVSVRARAAALREFAELIEGWTRCGAYGDEVSLRSMFAAGYKSLPQVEPLGAVLRRAGGRAAEYAHKFPRQQAEPPPAA